MKLFGGLIDLKAWPAWAQFLGCAGSFFVAMLVHDFLQELLFKRLDFSFGAALALVDCMGCSILPLLVSTVTGDELKTDPFGANARTFMLVSLMVVAGNALSTTSLNYINFPVKVVGRCGKLIPTMIIGKCLLGKSYSHLHYGAACCVSLGVAMFALADVYAASGGTQEAQSVTILGLLMLFGSVLLDAITPNVQERLMQTCTPQAVMMIVNFYTLPTLLLLMGFGGEMLPALAMLQTDWAVPLALCAYGTSTYIGVSAYMSLIQTFGAAVSVGTGTLRKLLTIGLSFFIMPKPFTSSHAFGLLAVVSGFALVSYEKHLKTMAPPKPLSGLTRSVSV